MAFGVIEWMAAIIALIALIKIVILLISPKGWIPVVKFFYGKPIATMIIAAILAIGGLWYLLQELTIVQIFAVLFFMSALMLVSAPIYSKDMISLAKKVLRDRKFIAKTWLPLIIWLVLVIWALKELFF